MSDGYTEESIPPARLPFHAGKHGWKSWRLFTGR